MLAAPLSNRRSPEERRSNRADIVGLPLPKSNPLHLLRDRELSSCKSHEGSFCTCCSGSGANPVSSSRHPPEVSWQPSTSPSTQRAAWKCCRQRDDLAAFRRGLYIHVAIHFTRRSCWVDRLINTSRWTTERWRKKIGTIEIEPSAITLRGQKYFIIVKTNYCI